MSASRRVKKGPGRRPQSAKRQRFVALRERGWSILGAAREVGVSRTTGKNWSRGYKVYRHGEVVGFVPALERLAVREISSRFLSQDERIEIADLRQAGLGIRQIAHQLGRAPSTISRELRRNVTAGQGYRPFEAHRRATARRARDHPRRVHVNGELGQLVGELLGQRWSPEQISRHLRLKFPDEPGMRLCHESIYQAFYQPGSPLRRPARESRCRTCSPDEASMGAVPFQEAKWALSGKRVMSPTSTSSLAAPEGPMPCSWVSVLPVAASSSCSSLSAVFLRW